MQLVLRPPLHLVTALALPLASIRLTLAALGLLAAGAWAVSHQYLSATVGGGMPLALLAINLLAALLSNRRLRADLPLALLHVALLAAVLMLAGVRLAYFDGLATLAVGEQFDGALEAYDAGPLHPWPPRERFTFRNDGFAERFSTKGDYVDTEHRVSWIDAAGKRHQALIGDDRPLLLAGYRIYAAPNRGYAPVFRWATPDGGIEHGSVQLPAPGFQLATLQPLTTAKAEFQPFTAAQSWHLPDGTQVWVMLEPASTAPPLPGATRLNLGAAELDHTLVVRVGDARHELRVGQSLQLPGGTLTYARLNSWMGYRIVRDDFMPWLLGACMASILSLGWFYLKRFRATSWLKGEV